jgi:hypothetical protein
MFGKMGIQPPAQFRIGNLMEGMIFRIMGRLQVVNHIHIGNTPVKQGPAIHGDKTLTDSLSSQKPVLTKELPQNPAGNVCGYHIGLQNLYTLIRPIMFQRFPIIPRYQQKKAKRLLKL